MGRNQRPPRHATRLSALADHPHPRQEPAWQPTQRRGTHESRFEEMQRLKALVPRSRAVADMTKDEIDRMTAGRMGTEHDHLNALLEKE